MRPYLQKIRKIYLFKKLDLKRPFSSTFSSRQLISYEPESSEWNQDLRENLEISLKIIPNFITEKDEESLVKEVEPHLKRLVYEKNHWDEAIIKFRETERKNWNIANTKLIDHLRSTAFHPEDKQLPYVHVLDLAEDGHIKPHIDSTRFCGSTVAVLSLLSDCVLKLVHSEFKNHNVRYFIPRRSLYVMTGASRYDYTHEILPNEDSFVNDIKVPKSRRISIVCRNEAS